MSVAFICSCCGPIHRSCPYYELRFIDSVCISKHLDNGTFLSVNNSVAVADLDHSPLFSSSRRWSNFLVEFFSYTFYLRKKNFLILEDSQKSLTIFLIFSQESQTRWLHSSVLHIQSIVGVKTVSRYQEVCHMF